MFPPKTARHALPSPPPGAPCWLVSHRSCHGPQLYSQTICPKAPRPAAEHGPRGSPPSRSCSSEAPNRVLGRCPGETQGWQPRERVCSPAKRVPPTVPRILPPPSQAPSLSTHQEQERISLGLQKPFHLFDLHFGHLQAGDTDCPPAQTEPTPPPVPGTLGVPQTRPKFLPGKGTSLLWRQFGAGSLSARTLLCCLYSRNAALPRKKCFRPSLACKGKKVQQCQLCSLSQRRTCLGELHLEKNKTCPARLQS